VQERALVMELVEGQTLSGPLPIETALNYARQIADALEAAHEKGIVHRDLKPANIMITAGGLVKVLDFGLAAVMQGPTSDPATSPTLTMRASETGVIIGTAGYMPPEQASGKPVDKRGDIWSFGVVLWEMLTGKRLFEGETISHTLADVLRGPIDLDRLPRETPSAIRTLLRRCLQRDLKRRLPDIGSARLEIDEALASGPEVLTGQGTALPHRLPWVVAAAAVLAAIAVGALYWRATRPVERPLVRLDVDLGPDASLPSLEAAADSVRLSPDGTRLVYQSGNPQRLFTRRLDQPTASELPGTERAQAPFFSPDGQWVGFFAANKVNKISVGGGAVVPLADYHAPPTGGSWATDGSIILGGAIQYGLSRIPDGGGVPTRLTELAKEELAQFFPQILPGGKAVVFVAYGARAVDQANIEVISLADRQRKVLVRGGTSPRYLPTGHLVYSHNGTLFAIAFDPVRLETHGTAVPLVDDLASDKAIGAGVYDISATGTLVYRKGGGAASTISTIQWMDGTGRKEPLRSKPADYQFPRLSPDGKRLVMVVREAGTDDLWVYDLQRDATTRLTHGGTFPDNPTWSPDGRYVVFGSVGSGILRTRTDGGGQPEPLIESKTIPSPWSFTPDGKRLAYSERGKGIFTVAVEEQGGQLKAGKPEPFFKSQSSNYEAAAFSPDGRWLAYESDESGKNELYVRAFPPPVSGQEGTWQISNSGADSPAWWSRDSRELLYQAGDQIMAVSYMAKGETFVAEKPRVWLAKVGGTAYDLSPDDKRVVVLAPVDAAEAPKADHEVVFLFNFLDELRRRVPTGR
jgi:Tol biopolymer transport system component